MCQTHRSCYTRRCLSALEPIRESLEIDKCELICNTLSFHHLVEGQHCPFLMSAGRAHMSVDLEGSLKERRISAGGCTKFVAPSSSASLTPAFGCHASLRCLTSSSLISCLSHWERIGGHFPCRRAVDAEAYSIATLQVQPPKFSSLVAQGRHHINTTPMD